MAALRWRLVLPVVLAGGVLLGWRLPASLMDSLLSRVTEGRLRLADTTGSFWRGRGVLAVDQDGRRLQALRALDWSLAPAGWGLRLRLGEHGQTRAELRLSPQGVEVGRLALDLPAAAVGALIDHALAHAGWRGHLVLSSSGFSCALEPRCEGSGSLTWHDAGTAMFPGRALGSHRLQWRALGRSVDFELSSLGTRSGALVIEGRGNRAADGSFSFTAEVGGDAELVERLPNIMNRQARIVSPGRVRISIP